MRLGHDACRPLASAQPVLAVSLIILSTVISLLPAIISGSALSGSESSANLFAWTALNAASQVSSAMANVAAQAFLARAGAHLPGPVGHRASLVGIFRFVFYNQVREALRGP